VKLMRADAHDGPVDRMQSVNLLEVLASLFGGRILAAGKDS
jgi:hypothetical protein